MKVTVNSTILNNNQQVSISLPHATEHCQRIVFLSNNGEVELTTKDLAHAPKSALLKVTTLLGVEENEQLSITLDALKNQREMHILAHGEGVYFTQERNEVVFWDSLEFKDETVLGAVAGAIAGGQKTLN